MNKIFIFLLTLFQLIFSQHSFSVISDPHLSKSNQNNLYRFNKIIEHINLINKDNEIKFIVILGDIAVDSSGIAQAIETFKKSNIPCIPIIGDNDSKKYYYQLMNSYYNSLTEKLETFKRQDSLNSNFSLIIDKTEYIFLDLVGDEEIGVLSDNSKKWLEEKIKEASSNRTSFNTNLIGNAIIFSHYPISDKYSGFSLTEDEVDKIEKIFKSYPNTINSNFCGHVHITLSWPKDFPIFHPLCNTYFTESCFNIREDIDSKISMLSASNTLNTYIRKICKYIPVNIQCDEVTEEQLFDFAESLGVISGDSISSYLVSVSNIRNSLNKEMSMDNSKYLLNLYDDKNIAKGTYIIKNNCIYDLRGRIVKKIEGQNKKTIICNNLNHSLIDLNIKMERIKE